MVIRSEVHSWLWAMEGTCCLSRPMCENQLEKKLAKQLLFVCLRELPSKRNRWERSQRRYWQEAADSILKAKKSSIESERGLATDSPARKRNGRRWALTSGPSSSRCDLYGSVLRGRDRPARLRVRIS